MQNQYLNYEDILNEGGTGRHETFTPRYGWLKKGYDAVKNDAKVFTAKDAIEQLGVGKNMVAAIRFWCLAFKLIKSDGSGGFQPTEFAEDLLDTNNGWDPYLEDIASLWLLHWQLFIPKLETVSWPIAFNKCNVPSFDHKQLGKIIINHLKNYPRFKTSSENSLERDASCITRMYLDDALSKETEIDCPFTQLGLIKRVDRGTYAFDTSDKVSLPPLVFLAACASYMGSYIQSGQKTIPLNSLIHNMNAPGAVFKLSESAAGDYLVKGAEELKNSISLINQAGTIQIHFHEEPQRVYAEALKTYYMKH